MHDVDAIEGIVAQEAQLDDAHPEDMARRMGALQPEDGRDAAETVSGWPEGVDSEASLLGTRYLRVRIFANVHEGETFSQEDWEL